MHEQFASNQMQEEETQEVNFRNHQEALRRRRRWFFENCPNENNREIRIPFYLHSWDQQRVRLRIPLPSNKSKSSLIYKYKVRLDFSRTETTLYNKRGQILTELMVNGLLHSFREQTVGIPIVMMMVLLVEMLLLVYVLLMADRWIVRMMIDLLRRWSAVYR